MILAAECIAACVVFSLIIVGSVLKNRESWISDYAPEVQKRFLECHPDYVPKGRNSSSVAFVAAKIAVCLFFTALLSLMTWLAGARDFLTGTLYSYIVWFVVNLFDAIVLDALLFAKWKRIRLPGTEDMDKEYASNWRKWLVDFVCGVFIGVPVALACGGVIALVQQLLA